MEGFYEICAVTCRPPACKQVRAGTDRSSYRLPGPGGNRSSTFPGQNHLKFLARRFRDGTAGLSFIATVPTIERRREGRERSFAICKHKKGTVIRLSIMHEEREGEFLRSIRFGSAIFVPSIAFSFFSLNLEYPY